MTRQARAEIRARVNPQGEEYDSRAGIAGYYRYGPRKVAELCDDKTHGVQVPTVRVHAEAYDRIASWVRDYAPVSLGGPFSVNGVERAPADAEALEQAWDIVWWRRLAYFTTLALTAFRWPVRSSVGMAQGRPHSGSHRSASADELVICHGECWGRL